MPVVPRQIERKTGTRPLPAGSTGAQINAPRLSLPGPVAGGGLDSVNRGQAAIAQGLRDIGGALGEIAQNEKLKADRSRVMEAETFLTKWEIENVYKGALQQRGKNAIGIASKVSQDYDIAMNQFRETLGNDDQKNAFDRLAVSRGLSIMRSLTSYEHQQSQAVYKSQMESTVEAEKERALLNVGNSEIYNNSTRNAVSAFQVWAKGEGLPQETVDRETEKIVNDIHFGAAQQLAAADPDAFLDSVDGTRDIGAVTISAHSSRGIRNNNPGNLRKTNDKWQGMNGNDSEGYLTFESPQAGLRALVVNLVNQDKLHGLKTINDIMGKYAPPEENDTASYIKFVSERVGVAPDKEINFDDPEVMSKFTNAVITMENGGNPYSAEMVDGAVRKVLKKEKTGLVAESPGLQTPGNIDLNARPTVPLEDGTVATVRSMSFNFGGKEVLIPTVRDNGDLMTEEEAIEEFKKTGKHLGKFDTPENATAYAERLHVSQEENLDQKQRALSNMQSYDSLTWEQQQKVITMANTLSDRRRTREDREQRERQEKNMFLTYTNITDPEKRKGITRESIIEGVMKEDLSGEQGRTLIKLLETDESKEDDLATFVELSRLEASGELKADDVINAQASGNLKNATAKAFITSITSNLSQNEAYKSGKQVIEAQFDKTDFGVVQGDSAERQAEALREFQRRSAAGEDPNEVADSIVNRLKQTAASDRVYRRTLMDIRKQTGLRVATEQDIDQAFEKIQAAAARGDLTKAEAAQKINALSRRKQEIIDGGL